MTDPTSNPSQASTTSQFRIARNLPYRFDRRRYPSTPYLIVNLATRMVWLARVVSPAAWILAFFQEKQEYGSHTYAKATEIYALCTLAFCFAMFMGHAAGLTTRSPILISLLCFLLILEVIQYQIWNVILRPAIQIDHRIYSATRTLLILFVQYVQIILLYATMYLAVYFDAFQTGALVWRTSLEFSLLTMTTVSFGTIVPRAGTQAAFLAASQAMVGIFFLGLIVSTTLSRTRPVQEVE